MSPFCPKTRQTHKTLRTRRTLFPLDNLFIVEIPFSQLPNKFTWHFPKILLNLHVELVKFGKIAYIYK